MCMAAATEPAIEKTGGTNGKELVLRGMGFQTMEQGKEQELTQYLLKQRDKIREYRRGYLEALMTNDTSKAEGIQEEFKRRYPELGPLQIKKADITAMETRRTHSRISRILKGFPKEYREQFSQVAATALAPAFFGPTGISPTLGQHYLNMGGRGTPSRVGSLYGRPSFLPPLTPAMDQGGLVASSPY